MTRTGPLFRLVLRSLASYPLRTLLTTLGVVFGVGAVIAMLAISTGAERALLNEIGRLGIQNIILNSVKPPAGRQDEGQQTQSWQYHQYGLTFKDARQIEATVPGLVEVLPVHKRPHTAWHGSRKLQATVYAVEPRHMELFGLEVVRGRNLTALDGTLLKRVCIIRAGLLTELGIFSDPIGLPLQIDDHYYTVVGVLEEQRFLGYARKALAVDSKTTEVYIPYGTALRRLGTRAVSQGQGSREFTNVELSQIVVSVTDLDSVLVTARMLQRVLEKNHEDQDYDMVVPLEVLQQRRRTQRIFNVVFLATACISLLVGGIGIANIMLATVTERTREIGIRRALGAKRRDIVAQFLAETTMISTLGGLLGVAVGFGFIRLLTLLAEWRAVVTTNSIVLALGISMAVGIVSGIFPARRAALLDPIAALRHE